MSDQLNLNVEATKLIKEWSVWMVAVEIALIAWMVTDIPSRGPAPLAAAAPSRIPVVSPCDRVALGCFMVSILTASAVLSGLPYIVIRLLETEDPNIYFMNLWSFPILKNILLWQMSTIQHFAFAI